MEVIFFTTTDRMNVKLHGFGQKTMNPREHLENSRKIWQEFRGDDKNPDYEPS